MIEMQLKAGKMEWVEEGGMGDGREGKGKEEEREKEYKEFE